MEPRIRIINVIGAAFASAVIAKSFGKNPVRGGMPPMDRSKSGRDRARTLWVMSLWDRNSEVSIFSVTISVNTGIRIIV